MDLDAVFDRVVETLLHCQQLAAWNASKIRDAQIVIIHKAGGNDVFPWSSLQLQQPTLPLQARLPHDGLLEQPQQQRLSPTVRLEREAWIDWAATRQMMKREKNESSIAPTEGKVLTKPENNRKAKRKTKGKKRKTMKKVQMNSVRGHKNVINLKTAVDENVAKKTDFTKGALTKGSVMSQGIQLHTDDEIKVELGASDLPNAGSFFVSGNLSAAGCSLDSDSQPGVFNDGRRAHDGFLQPTVIVKSNGNQIDFERGAVAGDANPRGADVEDVKENLDDDSLTSSADAPIPLRLTNDREEVLEEEEEEEDESVKKGPPSSKRPRPPSRECSDPPPSNRKTLLSLSVVKEEDDDDDDDDDDDAEDDDDDDAGDTDFDIDDALAEEREVKKKNLAPSKKRKVSRQTKTDETSSTTEIKRKVGRPRKIVTEVKKKIGRPLKSVGAPYCVEKSPDDGLFHCPECSETFEQQIHLIYHFRFVSAFGF